MTIWLPKFDSPDSLALKRYVFGFGTNNIFRGAAFTVGKVSIATGSLNKRSYSVATISFLGIGFSKGRMKRT